MKDKQPYIDLNHKRADEAGSVPTWDIAAEALFRLVESSHRGCVEAAEAARMAAAAQSSGVLRVCDFTVNNQKAFTLHVNV